MDYKAFFSRSSVNVAKDLLGRFIVRNSNKGSIYANILEIGAYEGGKEIKARMGMEYEPARLFLMPYRGSLLFNISTGKEMHPSCVEIRRIATHNKTIKGAGAASRFFGLTKNLDGITLGEEIQILGINVVKDHILETRGGSENCVGIYAIEE